MANVTTDGQKELEAMYRLFDYLEQRQIYGAEDKRTKLANKFFSYCKKNGGERAASFKLVPGKFKDEFEQRLMDANLPFAVMSDHRGNYAFLTRNIDGEEFLKIQQDIFKGHTEYYKELNTEEYLRREYRNNTDVLVMKFDSKEELEMFKNKSYENGKGFVISTEEVNGKYVAYASLKDAVSNDLHSDIPSTILRMQGDMSGIGAGFKKSQIEYDLRVKDDIMSKIKHNDTFTIMNNYDNKDDYLECVNGEIRFMEYNPDSGMFNNTMTPLEIPKNWNDEKEVKAFEDALSVQLAKVKNKKIMEPDQHRKFMNMSKHEMEEYAYKAKVKAFEEPGRRGVGRPYAGEEFTKKYLQDVINEKSKLQDDIKIKQGELSSLKTTLAEKNTEMAAHPSMELEGEIGALKAQIAKAEKELDGMKSTKETLVKKYKDVYMFREHKRNMDRAMESVVTTAHSRLVHSPEYQMATGKEKEEMLEEMMLTILRTRNTPELVKLTDFLKEHDCLYEYDELVGNVEKEFRDNINAERIDKLLDAIEEKKEKERANEKEKEAERDSDDEPERKR